MFINSEQGGKVNKHLIALQKSRADAVRALYERNKELWRLSRTCEFEIQKEEYLKEHALNIRRIQLIEGYGDEV